MASFWTRGLIRRFLAIALLFFSIALDGTKALAETFGQLRVISIDAEDATLSRKSSWLYDNDGAYFLHREGRGLRARRTKAGPKDHFLRFEIDPEQGTCKDKDRSEIVLAKKVPMDQEYRYLGFRIRIPKSQPLRKKREWFILTQFWQHGTPFLSFGMLAPENNSKKHHIILGVRGGAYSYSDAKQLDYHVVFESSQPKTLPSPFEEIGADLEPGRWHSFVFRFRIAPPHPDQPLAHPPFGYQNNGNLRVWKDWNVLVPSANYPMGYFAPRDAGRKNKFDIKMGLYKDCTSNPTGHYQVDLDDVRLGESYWDVIPK